MIWKKSPHVRNAQKLEQPNTTLLGLTSACFSFESPPLSQKVGILSVDVYLGAENVYTHVVHLAFLSPLFSSPCSMFVRLALKVK